MSPPFAALFQFGTARGAGLGMQIAFSPGVELHGAAGRHGAVDPVLIGQRLALCTGKAVTEGRA
ncbi:hypothetical protein ASE05_10595 [Mesorhizobium sp. Root172]|nr:hypothetical protein ASE05_10595 [Mesorhizobium sp. Root172]